MSTLTNSLICKIFNTNLDGWVNIDNEPFDIFYDDNYNEPFDILYP